MQATTSAKTCSFFHLVFLVRRSSVVTVVECYREKPGKNKEVRVMIAYNTAMAMEAAKNAVRDELKKKGDEIHEKLDGLLNL